MKHIHQQEYPPVFEVRILLICLLFVISGIFYVIAFGISPVSLMLMPGVNIIFTKWCSILIIPIFAIILIFIKKKNGIPYVIACIWFICFINIMSFLTSSTWIHGYIGDEIIIDIYNTAKFFGFSIEADIIKVVHIIISIYFTYYIVTSKYIKYTFK